MAFIGTLEILKISDTFKQKPFFFISSISSMGMSTHEITEKTPLPDSSSLFLLSGYAQSKWVAEKLLIEAQKRGYPICIIRPVFS